MEDIMTLNGWKRDLATDCYISPKGSQYSSIFLCTLAPHLLQDLIESEKAPADHSVVIIVDDQVVWEFVVPQPGAQQTVEIPIMGSNGLFNVGVQVYIR